MKKIRLKKWVVNVLGAATFLAWFMLGAECDSTKLFMIKTIVSGAIILINCYIFYKYTDLFEG